LKEGAGRHRRQHRRALTLVATCGINPVADFIARVQELPKRRLDEPLKGTWARAQANV
jgi:hypothetical protein